jgi:hypothetical protein
VLQHLGWHLERIGMTERQERLLRHGAHLTPVTAGELRKLRLLEESQQLVRPLTWQLSLREGGREPAQELRHVFGDHPRGVDRLHPLPQRERVRAGLWRGQFLEGALVGKGRGDCSGALHGGDEPGSLVESSDVGRDATLLADVCK